MKQFIWSGVVFDTTGYGTAMRTWVLEAYRAGYNIRIEPVDFGAPSATINEQDRRDLAAMVNNPLGGDEIIKIVHLTADHYHVDPRADKTYGWLYWETDYVSDFMRDQMNLLDGIIVSSKNNFDVLKSKLSTPVKWFPHGWRGGEILPISKDMKWLSVFQWQKRKAPELLLEAYNEAIHGEIPLTIKTYGWSNYEEISSTVPRGVCMISEPLPIEELDNLYRSHDVYIEVSRGEGLGLPYREAMQYGRPCIATGWGGQLDVVNQDTGWLVPYDMVDVDTRYFHLYGEGHKWAEPRYADYVKTLKEVANNYSMVVSKGKASYNMIKEFSWEYLVENLDTL